MRTAGPLVGRDAELAVVDDVLAALSDGTGGALAITGTAGIGKSRLLADLGDRADRSGHLVLTGSASELERGVPFGPFQDALDDHLAGLPPHRLARLDEGTRIEVGRVFPSMAGAAPGSGAAQDERYRTHRAVRTLLETLAARPLVVALDDVHWADSASIELLSALLRRPPAGRVLLVLAFRPRQLADRLTAELGRADRQGTLTRIDLEPLSERAAQQWLGEAVGRRALPALFAESGGVPFYLEQLARATGTAAATARAGPAAAEAGHVPPLVLASLAEELAMLSPAAHGVLEGASVAGDPFEPELAAAAADVEEPAAIDAIDELLALDFVRPTAVPRRFRFRHPLVRRAVYERASGGWRLRAHERCAAALAARGAWAEVRAHHVERSARQGDRAAAALLREAGTQAADRAPGTAARWFDGALRLLPDVGAEAERIELLMARARALAAVGRLRDSHAALEQAVALAPATDPARRAELVALCARAERFIGHHEGANQRLTAALESVEPDSREHVMLLLELAVDGFYRVARAPMYDWAQQAEVAAERLGDEALIGASVSMQALLGAWTGDVPRARAAIPRATELVDRLTDDQLATRLDAAANLAAAELYLDLFPVARRHAARVMDVGRATNQTELFPPMYAALGTALWMEGRLGEAADLLDGAVDAARLLDDDQGVAWTLFNRCAVALQRGDLDDALEFARESVELSSRAEPGLISALGDQWFGIALLEAGRPVQAIERQLRAGGEELPVIPGGWRAVYLEALCRARLEAGDVEGARRTAGHCGAWAEHVGLPLAAAMSARCRALVALSDGDADAAARAALESVAHAEEAGARVEAARSRTLAGRAFAAAGDRPRAVEELTAAAAQLAHFGARRACDAAEQELRRAGGKVSRRARPRAHGDGFASLSEREAEIARLTVERLTNRQIAARLFLSEKTVESHLRNVFHKLGVASRAEVAAVAERAGSDGDGARGHG